jgi:hypothetical protein
MRRAIRLGDVRMPQNSAVAATRKNAKNREKIDKNTFLRAAHLPQKAICAAEFAAAENATELNFARACCQAGTCSS